jgi:hypothetical protein
VWESNPPPDVLDRDTGFEVQEAHQNLSTSNDPLPRRGHVGSQRPAPGNGLNLTPARGDPAGNPRELEDRDLVTSRKDTLSVVAAEAETR